jgi:hypothetical protein
MLNQIGSASTAQLPGLEATTVTDMCYTCHFEYKPVKLLIAHRAS